RRTNRFSANKKAVTSRDHTPRSFASFRVATKRLVVDALLNLEGTDRFGGIGGFVDVSRHRDNLLVNGLGAFLFGKRKILRRRITLGNECLISAESDRDAINVKPILRNGLTRIACQKFRSDPAFSARCMRGCCLPRRSP